MTRPTTRHECDRDCGRAPGSCSDCPYIVKPSRILRNVEISMKLLRDFDASKHRHELMLDDAPVGTETGA